MITEAVNNVRAPVPETSVELRQPTAPLRREKISQLKELKRDAKNSTKQVRGEEKGAASKMNVTEEDNCLDIAEGPTRNPRNAA